MTRNHSFSAAGKTHPVDANPASTELKSGSKPVRGLFEPPDWDFRTHGILFKKDIEEAQKLKRRKPEAFKSSVRAQAIVAYSEQSLRWQIALGKAVVGNIPQPVQDLWIAADRKRKPKERLSAIDRFSCLFQKLPMNVAINLFKWLNGGSRSEVVKALDRTMIVVKADPKTGHLVETNGRGRKRSSTTITRIELAARRGNEGISQSKMARELFPNLPKEQAYARTRDFFLKNRWAIERTKYHLQHQPEPSRKSSY